MASMEFLQKRIDGAKVRIEKLNKKLQRIELAKASDYKENNPYSYSDYDLRSTKRELSDVTANLEKYEKQLEQEKEKADSRNVKVINDFLDQWVLNCIKYFESEYEKYLVAYDEFKKKDQEYCDLFHGASREERKVLRIQHTKLRSDFTSGWTHVTQFNHGCLSWHETMVKDLEQEKLRKYDDIIERTNDIVGKITDASELRVSPKGNLDGFISGEKGKAKVQTIGAGGYNIQCFHFRTLIKPV